MTSASTTAIHSSHCTILDVRSLAKVYKTGKIALDDINLSIEEPQLIAIIGSSGAGKSTFIRCINRLVEPTSGQILLKGMDMVPLNHRGLRNARRRIGMIFQEYNLVERLSVMQNVLSGRLGYVSFFNAVRHKFPPEDVQAAFMLLDRVGLEGYQNRRADALSGGQRQRVGIARSLMQQPELLLLDEPTASLDPKTSEQIMLLIKELVHERRTPAIINIHDVALAKKHADRIVGLNSGRIVFDDKAANLDADVLARIYGDNPDAGENPDRLDTEESPARPDARASRSLDEEAS